MQSIKKLALLGLMSMALVTSGCMSLISGRDYHSTYHNQPTESALQIVSQESQKALIAQQALVKYRQTYLDTITYRQANLETDNVMADYIGKPQALLTSLAIKYGYRFVEIGRTKELPTINFTHYYATPEQIIVAIDSQLMNEAKISLDKQQKLITLDYNQFKQ